LVLASSSPAPTGAISARRRGLVIGLLGIFLDENLQHVDAAKNVLVATVNGIAALCSSCSPTSRGSLCC
jgi:hypothetical protein